MPPHNIDAEKRLLSSVLLNPKRLADVRQIVAPGDFHVAAHGTIYEHMLAAEAVDVTILHERLTAAGELERCGGAAYLAEVLQSAPVAAHAVYYAKIVRDHAARRRAITDALEVVRRGYAGATPATLRSDLQAAAESCEAQDAAARFPVVTAAQLATAAYAVTFLIDRMLVADQPAFIGGAMKTCKTLVAIDAAISLATASPFLGAFEVPDPAPVAYMSGEGGLSVLQDYARRVADFHGHDLSDIGAMLMFCDRLPMLQDLEHVSALEAFIEHWEIKVVFLDPLYLCMPGDDAGNLMKQGKLLRHVNQVCVGAGCTPILLHHTRKNVADPYAPPDLADLSWAGFGEFAGQWWLLGRREKYSGETPGDHKLWLNVGGRAGHTGLHALDVREGQLSDLGGRQWEVDVLPPKEARQAAVASAEEAKEQKAEQTITRDMEKLCQAAAKHPQGATKNRLREAAGIPSASRMTVALARLIDNGDLVSCEVQTGNHKTPKEGYKLGD